jgi:hypothetical protein
VLLVLDTWRKAGFPRAFEAGLLITAGLVLVIAPFALYFALNGAWSHAWDGIIDYNFNYVQQSTDAEAVNWVARWASLERPIHTVRLSLVPIIAPIGWFATWLIAFRRERYHLTWFAWMLTVSAPLLVLMALMLSGRDYVYYYTAWLPAASMSIASLLMVVGDAVQIALGKIASGKQFQRAGIVASVILLLAVPVYSYQHPSMPGSSSRANYQRRDGMMFVLERELDAGESLLMWGNEPMFHVFSEFSQQNRYLYQYPLFFGPNRDAHIAEFWANISASPPKLIVDTKTQNTYMMPGFRDGSGEEWEATYGETLPEEFIDFRGFVLTCYELVEIDNDAAEMLGWDVYRYAPQKDPETCDPAMLGSFPEPMVRTRFG